MCQNSTHSLPIDTCRFFRHLLFSTMEFSKRTDWQPAENEITKLKTSLEREGKTIFDLTISNPAQCEFQYLKPELLKPLAGTAGLRYEPDPHGLLKAREAVSQYYARKGASISPERIFLAAGTSEAYSFIFRLVANPQDAILVPRPGYPLFDYLAGLNDLTVKHYPLVYQNGWRIESLPDTAPRALILVNPNNPTGNFIRPEEFDLINRFANTNGIAIISDEVFFDFAFGKQTFPAKSFAQNKETLTFTLGGISKAIGLPQMKLAWVVVTGPDHLTREAIRRLEIICDTYLSVSTPSQNALSFWLGQVDRIQEGILARLEQNRAFLKQKLSGISGVQLFEAEGGWYATIEIEGQRSDEEWALLFLKEDHVYVYPGYFFDFPEGNFLVLSLLPPPAIFEEAVDRLSKKFKLSVLLTPASKEGHRPFLR